MTCVLDIKIWIKQLQDDLRSTNDDLIMTKTYDRFVLDLALEIKLDKLLNHSFFRLKILRRSNMCNFGTVLKKKSKRWVYFHKFRCLSSKKRHLNFSIFELFERKIYIRNLSKLNNVIKYIMLDFRL